MQRLDEEVYASTAAPPPPSDGRGVNFQLPSNYLEARHDLAGAVPVLLVVSVLVLVLVLEVGVLAALAPAQGQDAQEVLESFKLRLRLQLARVDLPQS